MTTIKLEEKLKRYGKLCEYQRVLHDLYGDTQLLNCTTTRAVREMLRNIAKKADKERKDILIELEGENGK